MFDTRVLNIAPIVVVLAVLVAAGPDVSISAEIKPGDTAVVVSETAKLTVGDKVLVELPRGTRVNVTGIRGNWLGVAVMTGDTDQRGWVRSSEVAPLAPSRSETADASEAPAAPPTPALPEEGAIRTWTAVDGRTVRAALVDRDASTVRLRTADGKIHVVPLARLNPQDRDYVQSMLSVPSPGPAVRRTPANAELRRLPLVIQQGDALLFLSKDDPAGVRTALSQATNIPPGEDVLAATTAAKSAGEAAGFEFEPVRIVEAKQKPSDCIASLSGDADVVLFVRASTSTQGSPGVAGLLGMRVAAALIGRSGQEVLDADHWIGVKLLEGDKLTSKGDKLEVEARHRFANAVAGFDEGFGWKVLLPLQQRFLRDEIAREVAKLRAAGHAQRLTPKIEFRDGTPELSVIFSGPGRCDLFIGKSQGEVFRKCRLRPGAKPIEFGVIEAGNWLLYAEVSSEDAPEQRPVYQAAFTAKKDGEEYRFEIPGAPGRR